MTTTQTLEEFIETNRARLQWYVVQRLQTIKNPYPAIPDDELLRKWISNDYELYRWAISSGVEI